jgi:hypothetical protein
MRGYIRTTVICAVLGLIFSAVIPFSDARNDEQQAYYGFYPSKQGPTYKRFVHNTFGFAIDIPSNWVFGVAGKPPTAVVLVYPEGMNTREFSSEWEVIEIGQIPAHGLTLEEALDTTMRGMRAGHPNLKVLEQPTKNMATTMHAISCAFQWQSRTGFTVTERVTLIQAKDGIRSIGVKTTRKDNRSRNNFYDRIIKTFEVFSPKYRP